MTFFYRFQAPPTAQYYIWLSGCYQYTYGARLCQLCAHSGLAKRYKCPRRSIQLPQLRYFTCKKWSDYLRGIALSRDDFIFGLSSQSEAKNFKAIFAEKAEMSPTRNVPSLN